MATKTATFTLTILLPLPAGLPSLVEERAYRGTLTRLSAQTGTPATTPPFRGYSLHYYFPKAAPIPSAIFKSATLRGIARALNETTPTLVSSTDWDLFGHPTHPDHPHLLRDTDPSAPRLVVTLYP